MKRLLCLGLALILLLGALASCKKEQTEEPLESEIETDVSADPLSDYTIVRPQISDKYQYSVITEFQSRLESAAGGTIELLDDALKEGETAENDNKEILVGKTNRPESIAVYEELGDSFRYMIRQVGNKLVVAAPTTELLGMALEYLTKNYVKTTLDGTYPIAKDISYASGEMKYIELVTKKTLNYDIVYPSELSQYMLNAINSVKNALKSVAGKEPVMIKDNSDNVLSADALVLGPVDLPGVAESLAEIPYLGYQVYQNYGLIYYLAADEATSVEICNQLAERIACGKYEDGTVRLVTPTSKVQYIFDWAEELPVYPSNGGTLHSIEECSDDIYRIYYTNTTMDSYNEYSSLMELSGFTLYAENKIGNHVYRTYEGENCMAHLYYTATTKETRLVVGDLGKYDLEPVSDGDIMEPVFTLMAPDYNAQATGGENGMGMIFTMKDGSFVIVDGGWGYDTKGLYEYLVTNNNRKDGILIRAWIITHPHEDHYGNIVRFAASYADKVTVEKLVANFAQGTYAIDGSASDDIAIIMPALEKFKGAEFIVPQVGQVMYFGDMKMEFLYTVECAYPAADIGNSNNHSLCAKIDFYGKDILMTGDAYRVACNYLVNTFGSYIQSKYLQVPHHNGNGGTKNFYAQVRPEIILVPTTQEKYDRSVANKDELIYYLLKSVGTVKKIYVGDNGYKEIE